MYLKSPVDAFTVTETHLEPLRRAFPEWRFENCVSREAFIEKLAAADAVITWTFKAEWYALAPRLTAVFTPAAGREWIAADPSSRVRHLFGHFHGTIMRESLLWMMLHFTRAMSKPLEQHHAHVWERNGLSSSRLLTGKRVLIIGYGAIGKQCGRMLSALGCTVVGAGRQAHQSDGNAEKIISFTDIKTELPLADHVVFILPGGSDTDGIFTREHFEAMRSDAYLYNIGRGNCYREEELVRALESGIIAGAGLDVFGEEPLSPLSRLWNLPNVLLLPHASAICREYMPYYIEELIIDFASNTE